MSDPANVIRTCPFCKEEIKTTATRCIHCHADIPAGADGSAQLPIIQGRQIRALPHPASVSSPVIAANRGPSSKCNHFEIDDAGIWEYIGEDAGMCYYWGPK